jgi:hypothetical protein
VGRDPRRATKKYPCGLTPKLLRASRYSSPPSV